MPTGLERNVLAVSFEQGFPFGNLIWELAGRAKGPGSWRQGKHRLQSSSIHPEGSIQGLGV